MNTPGKLFVLFSIMISLSCRAGDKSDQSAAGPSHFTSFAQALVEAKRVVDTDPGKAYDVEFSMAITPRLSEIVGECTKNSGPRVVFDVVFVFAANGEVEQVFTSPDQPAAACVGERKEARRNSISKLRGHRVTSS